MNNLKILLIASFFFLLNSCGFKVLNKDDSNSFEINNIEVNGDKRLASTLENNIIIYSKNNSPNQYNLEINIKSFKTSKIKNATGKTTRYSSTLKANVKIYNLNNKQNIDKDFYNTQDFDVGTTHSETLNNEKIAINNSINIISEDITKFIKLMDFK